MSYSVSHPHITDYSAVANDTRWEKRKQHPWGHSKIESGPNPFKSIAVRFPITMRYRNDASFRRNQKAWRAYLVKELSKIEGGLDGMTL